MKTALIIGAAAAGGLGLWWLLGRTSSAAAATAAAPAPSAPNVLQQLEAAAPYGQLATAVGHAAQKAPTLLKAVVPVIALNAAVQSVIDNPKGAAKTAYNDTKAVVKAVIPGSSSCSGDCSAPKTVADARAFVNALPTIAGLRDCARKVCSQKFGVQI